LSRKYPTKRKKDIERKGNKLRSNLRTIVNEEREDRPKLEEDSEKSEPIEEWESSTCKGKGVSVVKKRGKANGGWSDKKKGD